MSKQKSNLTSIDDSSFAERLKKAIGRHDLNYNEFAKKSGISLIEINHWISGESEPNIKNLEKLLKALPKTRIDWLITGENL